MQCMADDAASDTALRFALWRTRAPTCRCTCTPHRSRPLSASPTSARAHAHPLPSPVPLVPDPKSGRHSRGSDCQVAIASFRSDAPILCGFKDLNSTRAEPHGGNALMQWPSSGPRGPWTEDSWAMVSEAEAVGCSRPHSRTWSGDTCGRD